MRSRTCRTILVLSLAVWLAACTGDDDSGGTTIAATTAAGQSRSEAPATTIAAATTTVPADSSPEAFAGDGVVIAQIPTDLGRSIVFTANLAVEVADVFAAGTQAQAAVSGLGGFLFGQDTSTGDEPRSVLTIKVPPQNFQQALQRLIDLGTLKSESVFADDVTERVVDLQSQITTAEASVARLREFLTQSGDLEDLATLEAELLQRETDLEVLRGRLRTLQDQVALATIVVVFTEPTPPVPEPAIELVVTAYDGHDGGEGCPGAEQIRINENEDMTVCFMVTNIGDTALGDIEVGDSGLDAAFDDLILVQGDLEVPLQPDEFLLFAFEATAARNGFSAPTVTATALTDSGNPTRRQVSVETEGLQLTVVNDNSLPGFTDAMGAAWAALQQVLGVVVVAAGALVPFLWVPIIALAILWWRRKHPGEPGEAPTEDAEAAGA